MPVFSDIKCRIHEIHIFLIQLLPQQLDRLAKSLEVYNFPFPKEFDYVIHIRIIRQPQDIVIGNSGLLLCYVVICNTGII